MIVLEMNADNVAKGKDRDDPVYYADATSEEALGHAHVESARAVVVMINDHKAAERVLATINRLSIKTPVFVRSQYVSEIDDFKKFDPAGIVACEIEGGLEILSKVLRQLEIPRNLILREIEIARAETMSSDRQFEQSPLPLHGHLSLKELIVESILLEEGSVADGKNPLQLDLAEKTGVMIIAIKRGESLFLHRLAEKTLEAGDVLYCIGQMADLVSVSEWLDPNLEEKTQT